jgi:hypothetical protein
MAERFTISDAWINANGPAHLGGVRFVRCLMAWDTKRPGVVVMRGCEFDTCVFLVDGMEVSWDEFCALTAPRDGK